MCPAGKAWHDVQDPNTWLWSTALAVTGAQTGKALAVSWQASHTSDELIWAGDLPGAVTLL